MFFVPELVLTLLSLYYFSFILVESESLTSYMDETWDFIVRLLILLLDVYFLVVYLYNFVNQVLRQTKKTAMTRIVAQLLL
jgi:hypothetical protein